MFRWIFFIVFVLIVELYAFQALKTITKAKWLLISYQLVSLAVIVFIIYSFTQFDRTVGQNRQSLITFGLLLLVFIPKIIVSLFMLGEDVYRVFSGVITYFLVNTYQGDYLPE